jgi:hypothetical protein
MGEVLRFVRRRKFSLFGGRIRGVLEFYQPYKSGWLVPLRYRREAAIDGEDLYVTCLCGKENNMGPTKPQMAFTYKTCDCGVKLRSNFCGDGYGADGLKP